MASTLMLSLVIALISVLTTIPPSMSFLKTRLKGFEARLIHRDSPNSPLYNPNATRAQLLQSARRRSNSRQNYFTWLMSAKTWGPNYIRAPIDVEHGDYIMRYKLGTPGIDTFGFFDTGSTLIWVQCQPCEKCYNQSIPIYDPKTSSTYEKVRCSSRLCKQTSDSECPDLDLDVCRYTVHYQDGGSSKGVIAKETIKLDNDDPAPLTVVVFGCGHSNSDQESGYTPPGVVGASRETSSLVGQFAFSHFSYCISPDNEGNRSSLRLGSKAVINEEVYQTQLLLGRHGYYYLNLEGISVGGTMLNISKSAFEMDWDGNGGFFMDSGSTYTYLVAEAFYALKQEVESALRDFEPDPDPERFFPLCYTQDDFELDLTPDIVFHFAGGLKFSLWPSNAWEEDDDEKSGKTCLAIKPNYYGKYSVFGLHQHRSVNVGYDLDNNVVSFKYASDCVISVT